MAKTSPGVHSPLTRHAPKPSAGDSAAAAAAVGVTITAAMPVSLGSHAGSRDSLLPHPSFRAYLPRKARANSLTSFESSSRLIIRQVSNDRGDSGRTTTPFAGSARVLGLGGRATPAIPGSR